MEVSREYLEKRYNTACFGNSYIGFITYTEDHFPAAFYGVLPCKLIYKGREIPAAQSADTMTHKDHQGKMLILYPAEKTMQLIRESGIKFVFGFPNKLFYPIQKGRMKWKETSGIMRYTCKIFTLPLAKLAKKIPALNPAYQFYVKCILSLFRTEKILLNSVCEKDGGGVLRNDDFFFYKTDKIHHFIELSGVKIWLKADIYLWIGDMERMEKPQAENLLKKLKLLAFFLGADTIQFFASVGSRWDPVLNGLMKSEKIASTLYFDLESGIENLAEIIFTGADFDTF